MKRLGAAALPRRAGPDVIYDDAEDARRPPELGARALQPVVAEEAHLRICPGGAAMETVQESPRRAPRDGLDKRLAGTGGGAGRPHKLLTGRGPAGAA